MAAPTLIDATTGNTPPPSRRWVPLSLRMFVAALLLIGIAGLLWTGVRAYCQHRLIRKIEGLGGEVVTHRGPRWLRDLIGDRWMRVLAEPRSIWFEGSNVGDEDLLLLEDVPNLEAVGLNGTGITDAGLAHLKKVTGLRMLILDGKVFSEDAIADLRRALPSLRIRE